MKMQEVVGQADRKEFLQFPLSIYKGFPAWIQPLNQDVESVFDPAKNKTFKHGECARWLLKNDQGVTIGRIAAFVNQRTPSKEMTSLPVASAFLSASKIKMLHFSCSIIASIGYNSEAWRPWTAPSILAAETDGGDCWWMDLNVSPTINAIITHRTTKISLNLTASKNISSSSHTRGR